MSAFGGKVRGNHGDFAAKICSARLSAFGPKRTYRVAPHMSAFGSKADLLNATCVLLTKSEYSTSAARADITTREKLPSRREISARLVHLPEAHGCGFQARRISRPESRLRACGLHQMVSTHHYGCEGPASAP